MVTLDRALHRISVPFGCVVRGQWKSHRNCAREWLTDCSASQSSQAHQKPDSLQPSGRACVDLESATSPLVPRSWLPETNAQQQNNVSQNILFRGPQFPKGASAVPRPLCSDRSSSEIRLNSTSRCIYAAAKPPIGGPRFTSTHNKTSGFDKFFFAAQVSRPSSRLS